MITTLRSSGCLLISVPSDRSVHSSLALPRTFSDIGLTLRNGLLEDMWRAGRHHSLLLQGICKGVLFLLLRSSTLGERYWGDPYY